MLKTRTNKLQAVRLIKMTKTRNKLKRRTLRSGLEMLKMKLLKTTKLNKVKRRLKKLVSLRKSKSLTAKMSRLTKSKNQLDLNKSLVSRSSQNSQKRLRPSRSLLN